MQNFFNPKHDTHNYKGWLNSDSFLKRSLATFGYNTIGSFVVIIPFYIILFMLAFIFMSMFGLSEGMHGRGNMGGKLNISQICNDSLMYKTFESGEQAEAYVKECVDGKYPEVINEWKNMRGMNNGEAL